jgi:putative flavoprotein involved in K+ transport
VVATGPYQRPVVPNFPLDQSAVFQSHTTAYKSPDHLPQGAVLIVGSGASGAQIAEELQLAGRRVYLSVGRHRRMPRRYRERDLIWWLSELRLDRTPVERRGPDRTLPLITGAYGGHTIDFRDFSKRGITLLGRISGARDGKLEIASDLAANIAHGDAAYMDFLDRVDAHVNANNMDLPADPAARAISSEPGWLAKPVAQLDLHSAGVKSLIWATGYALDFDWIKFPVFDSVGELKHRGGVTEVPGLYFLGLQWLSRMSSSFLSGVGYDAARLADHIVEGQRSDKAD